jgi:hypothetical protein
MAKVQDVIDWALRPQDPAFSATIHASSEFTRERGCPAILVSRIAPLST